jgi:phosphatidylinositol glycan class P protein
MGIFFYPDKTWALTFPSLIVITILFTQIFYQGVNMSITREPDSLDLIEGTKNKEKISF